MPRSDTEPSSLRSGEFVARLSLASLTNPSTPHTPPTPFALAYTRLNRHAQWSSLGATRPTPAPSSSPNFDASPLPIPYDLGQAPQLRVEVYDLVDREAGVTAPEKQYFLGAAEFEIGEVIARDYSEVTHRLENVVDTAFTSGRFVCGTATIAALELRGSIAALARYAKAHKEKAEKATATAPAVPPPPGNGDDSTTPSQHSSAQSRHFLLSADAYDLKIQDKDGVAPAPFLVYFTKRAKDDKWKLLGRTRTVYGEVTPKFIDQFTVSLHSADVHIRVEVYNQVVPSDNLLDQQFVGAAEVSTYKLLGAPGMKGRLALVNSLVSGIKPGEVTLRMEPIDNTKTKIFFDVESGPVKRKGLAGGAKARMAYRMSSLEKKGWIQAHASSYQTSGEVRSGAAPAVTVTATTSKKSERPTTLVGNNKPDMRWERALHKVDENAGVHFRFEFLHSKKQGAVVESLGRSEMTLAQMRALHVGEHFPVKLDKLTVGRLVMKHQERAEAPRYFALQLIYGESPKFKGE